MHIDTDPESLRSQIAGFDDTDRRVLGGLTLLMVAESHRVKDREWIAERFVQLAILAHGFETESPPQEDIAAVQRYAHERMDQVVNTAFGLFIHTAETLKGRGESFGMDDAKLVIEDFVGAVELPGDPEPDARDT